LFQQSLAILTQRFPQPQTDIGRATANLAEVYAREKWFTEAASAFDQALTILERTLGPRVRNWSCARSRISRRPRAWRPAS